jgi:putative SOS response-associated peptidase YedK
VCLRYVLSRLEPEDLLGLDLAFLPPDSAIVAHLLPGYNVALTDPAPLVDGAGLRAARFGVNGPRGRPLGNARDDQLGAYWRRRMGARCLVPANGYYEWTADKQPWYFTHRDQPVLWLAGLAGDGGFAIVTTSANADAAPVHARMPVVLDPAGARTWLAGSASAAAALAAPSPAGTLRRWRVGKTVGNVRSAGPELIEPAPAEPSAAGLFGE